MTRLHKTGFLATLLFSCCLPGLVQAQTINGSLEQSTAPGDQPGSNYKITFARARAGGGGDIYIMDFDGQNITRLTTYGASSNDATNDNGKPIFCPLNDKIYFHSNHEGHMDWENLYRMDLDGSNVEALTTDDNRHWYYDLDGDKIYYLHNRGSNNTYSMNLDGSNKQQLSWGGGVVPSDVNKGSLLISPLGTKSLTKIDVTTGVSTVVLEDSSIDQFGNPTWSEDGSTIVFTKNQGNWDVGNRHELWLVNADGSNPRKVPLPADLYVGGHPRTTPDDSLLIFAARSDFDGDGTVGDELDDIYTAKLDGSELTNITQTSDYAEWDAYVFVDPNALPIEPVAIRLSVAISQDSVLANGIGESAFTVSVLDADGAVVTSDSSTQVALTIDGPAELVGDSLVTVSAGRYSGTVRSATTAGLATLTASVEGLESGIDSILVIDPEPFSYQGDFDGHAYYLSRDVASWDEAWAQAEEMGGYLVVISSAEENAFIYEIQKKVEENLWLGYTDKERERNWVWVVDEGSSYTNWIRSSQPDNAGNEDFAEMRWGYKGEWNDESNDTDKVEYNRFVVEVQSAPVATQLLVTISQDSVLSNGIGESAFTVSVLDAEGNVVTADSTVVTLTIDGPAELVGDGQVTLTDSSFSGTLRSTSIPGQVTLTASAEGLTDGIDSLWSVVAEDLPVPANAVEIGRWVVADPTQNASTDISFDVPQNGRLICVMHNPDGSRDGFFSVRVPADRSRRVLNNIHTYKHPDVYDTAGTGGLTSSRLEVDIDQGSSNLRVSYSHFNAPDNRGPDELILYYEERPITTEGAELLTSFSPGPRDETALPALEIEGPGEVVVDVTQIGSFGGGFFVFYVDGYALGHTETYINSFAPIVPHKVAIPFPEARTYSFVLAHDDSYSGDNSGSRHADVYFRSIQTEPPAPVATQLAVAIGQDSVLANGIGESTFTVSVLGADGNVMTSDNSTVVTLSADGPAELVGDSQVTASAGICSGTLRSTTTSGLVTLTASAEGLTAGVDSILAVSPEPDPQRGPVAYYPFNGNASDESGNGKDGTVDGAVLTTDRLGNAGSAYLFDGEDDSISLPYFSKFEAFTKVIWARIDSSGSVEIFQTGNAIWEYIPDIDRIHFAIHFDRNGGADRPSGISTSAYDYNFPVGDIEGRWVQLALVFAVDGNARFYIDGTEVEVGDRRTDSGMTGKYNVANIGARGNTRTGSTGFFFKGAIDDVRLYDRALEAAEIQALYAEEAPPAPVASQLVVAISQDSVLANGVGESAFTVTALDADSNVVTADGTVVTLTIDGAAELVGDGQVTLTDSSFSGTLRSTNTPGIATLTASAEGLTAGSDSVLAIGIPRIDIVATTLDFGAVPVGSSATMELVIRNAGNDSLRIGETTVDAGDFEVELEIRKIAPGDSVTAGVTFAPQSPGSKSAVLRLSTNDPQTAVVELPLSGQGQASLQVAVRIGSARHRSPYRARVGRTLRFEVSTFSAPDTSDLQILEDYTWEVPPELGTPVEPGELDLTTVAGAMDTILFHVQGRSVPYVIITKSHSITRVEIEPSVLVIEPGGKQTFRAYAYDRYDNMLLGQKFGWHLVGGIGEIDRYTGRFTAGENPGEGYVIAVVNKVLIFSDAGADVEETGSGTGKVVVKHALPERFSLDQNFPNPFNPSTEIRFALPVGGTVQLTIFNLAGQQVERLVDGHYAAGFHRLSWEASGHPSGVYIYQLRTDSFVATRKMLLTK
jgi:hypothetical protein